ncbi:MAG: HAD family phosphatase [Candidatus Micrarchaeota archaeon]
MIHAALFDFDGVIVKSEPLHKKTFLNILSPYGVEISDQRWFQEFAGTGSRRIFRALMDEYGIDADVEEFAEKRRAIFMQMCRDGRMHEMDGLKEFLKLLEEKGVKAAIVSGGNRGYIELLLESLGIKDSFSFIVSADDIPQRKPDPEPFLLASRELGVPPEECLVIEDSYAGCKAGRAAGMKVAWLRPYPSMEPPECDLVIENLKNEGLKSLLG